MELIFKSYFLGIHIYKKEHCVMCEEGSGDEFKIKDEYFSESDEDSDTEPSSSKRPRRSTIQTPDVYESEEIGKWTDSEEREILNALKDYGTSSIKAIAARMPSRTESDVKEYLQRKKKLGLKILKGNSAETKEDRQAPIDKWIPQLCKMIPNDDYKFKHVGRALKYIALFEEREEENESESGINLRDLYLVLSSFLTGDCPKYSNRETSCLMYDIIQNFAKEIRGQSTNIEKRLFSSITRPTSSRCYGKKKKEGTIPICDVVINPLQIPEETLKK